MTGLRPRRAPTVPFFLALAARIGGLVPFPRHDALPMAYLVDGLRHLIYGGGLAGVGIDVAALGGWLLAGLVLSGIAARKQWVWTSSMLRPELAL